MIDSLRRLGLCVEHDPAEATISIEGCAGRLPVTQADLYAANSGTTIRFLTALVALGHGRYRLDGTPRMRQRPIQDLLDALRPLGANARSETDSGCPPVVVEAAGLRGGRTEVAGSISSQFLSALLMAAPCAESPVEIAVRGRLVSEPYVRMTLGVMRAFGVEVEHDELQHFRIPAAGSYRACRYPIEPDASAASYFFGAAAVSGGRVTVEGLSRHSLQGDVAFCECLRRMGCRVEYGEESITVEGAPLRGIQADMNAISDTVPTLAAVALFAEGPTTITGVGHIRHKETDRLKNMPMGLPFGRALCTGRKSRPMTTIAWP